MAKGRATKQPLHDLTGQTFGYLRVDKMAQTKKSIRGTWRPICTCLLCGKIEVDVDPSAIKRGRTTSCGCRRDQYDKIRGSNSVQFKGYGDLSGKTWGTIKSRSKKRNIKFEISIEQAWNLFEYQKGKCALTGLSINLIGNKRVTASLDRIDSSKGYIISNIQWVLAAVNIMKNTYPLDVFVNICRKVSEMNTDIPELTSKQLIERKWNDHVNLK